MLKKSKLKKMAIFVMRTMNASEEIHFANIRQKSCKAHGVD
jgi:hypothetical protein